MRDRAQRRSQNESRYTAYELPYDARVTGEGALRPAIKIETALWPLNRPAVERPVISFVAEALHRPPEIAAIDCVSIVETAADKLVGLTRRAGAELAGLDDPDPTLVRHLHDLHALRAHYDAAEVAALARAIMRAEVEAYGGRFPAYRENPMRETLRAVEGLAADAAYARR
jgi:Nucleotidyl transferase AbiEii toxin, Type IV TA system